MPIKSSSPLVSELRRDEKYKSRHGKPPWERPHLPLTVLGTNVLEVPEKKTNPLVNGYRNPSDYFLRAYCNWDTPTKRHGFVVNGEVPRSVTERSDYYGTTSFGVEGNEAVMYRLPTMPNYFNLIQHARTKILNNIKDEVLDVAMVLAEIRETAQTGANLMYRIGRSMDALRTRKRESFNWLMHGRMGADNRRPTDKFLRETAGLFLEWKYGIMPTIYDLEDATKALDASADGSLFDRPPMSVARANVKTSDDVNTTLEFPWGSPANIKTSCKIDTTIACRADYRVSGDALRGLSEYGIGLGTVATVLYDRTPFSFVANMVMPMAELIKAWTALAGVEPIGYTETQYSTFSFKQQRVQRTYQSWKYLTQVRPSKVSTFTRLGTDRPPMPLPFIRNPVKVENISTVLALFTQLRQRPKHVPKLYGFDNKDL